MTDHKETLVEVHRMPNPFNPAGWVMMPLPTALTIMAPHYVDADYFDVRVYAIKRLKPEPVLPKRRKWTENRVKRARSSRGCGM